MANNNQPWYAHYTQSTAMGQSAQDAFSQMLTQKRGLTLGAAQDGFRTATRDEQRKHIDFVITKGGKVSTIDVKAQKKDKRSGVVDDVYLWVEFKNEWGYKGWIYSSVDYIALEYKTQFLIVKPAALAKIAQALVSTEQAKNADDAAYKTYSRWQNFPITKKKEKTSKIKYSDIEGIILARMDK